MIKTLFSNFIFVMAIAIAYCALIDAREHLPERVTYSNMAVKPEASFVARTAMMAVMATNMTEQKISDFGLFKVADVAFNGTDEKLVFIAFPYQKWYLLNDKS